MSSSPDTNEGTLTEAALHDAKTFRPVSAMSDAATQAQLLASPET